MTQKEILADHERRLKALEERVAQLESKKNPLECCSAYGAQAHQNGCVNNFNNA